MTAEALVAILRERGVTLRSDGDQLVIRPVSAVRPEEIEALRECKAEIMTLLSALTAPVEPATLPGVMSWCYPWPTAIAALGHHHVGPLDLCADCSRGTWVRYGAVVLCFACARTRAEGAR